MDYGLNTEQASLAEWLGRVAGYARDCHSTPEACWVAGLEMGLTIGLQGDTQARKLLSMLEALWANANEQPAELYERVRRETAKQMTDQVDLIAELTANL